MAKFTATLSVKSLDKLKKELEEYRTNTLPTKIDIFIEELMKRGITVAKQNLGTLDENGNVSYLVTFSTELKERNGLYCGVIYAADLAKIQSVWLKKGKPYVALVSPLLMYEFGSGTKARNPNNVAGVGQGTFPNPTDKNHAFNKEGWYWKALDGTIHHSYGITPTQPMYKASLEIIKSINQVAKEVRKL